MSTEIEKEFKKIFNSKEGLAFRNYCNEYTLWDILGMFRYEDANTNFLAAFLDAKRDIFKLGTEPLEKFIELICKKGLQGIKKIKGDFSLIGDLKNDDIEINIRQKYKNLNEQPDLVIILKKQYIILLEAKLEAGESKKTQCKDYYDMSKDDYPNAAYVYLSLDNHDSISDEEHYLKITYQDLINDLYEPFLDKDSPKDFLHEYLKGFMSLVKYNFISDNFKMPITTVEKNLVKNIYSIDKNRSIIDTFVNEKKKNKFSDDDSEIYIEIFFIILYKILQNAKPDLALKIKEKCYRPGLILIDKSENPEIIKTTYGDITKHIIEKIKDSYGIDFINNLSNTEYKYIYTKEEFDNQGFTEHQKDYYTDFPKENSKYKILSSYYYLDVIDFLEALQSHNIHLKNIIVKNKIDDKIIYPVTKG